MSWSRPRCCSWPSTCCLPPSTRCRRWAGGTAVAYGAPWAVGDVITVALDADAGAAAYSRNGAPLGVAVRRLTTGREYYAALSLSQGEAVELNTGQLPLRYPLPGFAVRRRARGCCSCGC